MVIPWTIFNIDDPGLTFLTLHQKLCAGSLILMLERFAGTLQQSQLVSACVGATKDNLSSVDINLPVDEVCRSFGSFAKLLCEEEKEPSQQARATTTRYLNAFEVMMVNQLAHSKKRELPSYLKEPKNNKDKLFNDLVRYFEEKEWKWMDGGGTHGKRFITSLRDVLWYIDGHHSTFEDRYCKMSDPFDKFVGYNSPEKSKHRKRQIGNLSVDVLEDHVQTLKESQLTSWTQQPRWNELRDNVCKLTTHLYEMKV